MAGRTRQKVVIEHDDDPDWSWLQQDHYDPKSSSYTPVYPTVADMRAQRNAYPANWYRNPDNHVALQVLLYELAPDQDDWTLKDSVGGIDFLASEDDWCTGTFYRLSTIPRSAGYLRTIARELGLR